MFFFFFMCTPGSINQTSVFSFILRIAVIVTLSCRFEQSHDRASRKSISWSFKLRVWGRTPSVKTNQCPLGKLWEWFRLDDQWQRWCLEKKQWWLLKRLGRMLLYHQLYQNQGVYFIDRRATMEIFFDGQDVSTLLSTASARAWFNQLLVDRRFVQSPAKRFF